MHIKMEKSKIIVLDYGMFIHRAGYASRNNPNIPVTYTAINMMVSSLRKVGVSPFDEVVVAADGRGNWRKDFEKSYKANRAEKREESGLNWDKMYKEFDWLLDKISGGTSWHIIKIDKIEADDIASVACRFFKDKEIVLVSFDSDWEMLWNYPNVKVFSPLIKFKGQKGAYKIPPKNFNVYQFISKKIKKEVSDNLVNPILNEKDYENRKICVNLLELPEYVENQIIAEFQQLKDKDSDLNYIPFESIRGKIASLYNDNEKVVTYQECIEKSEKKKIKKKKSKERKRR